MAPLIRRAPRPFVVLAALATLAGCQSGAAGITLPPHEPSPAPAATVAVVVVPGSPFGPAVTTSPTAAPSERGGEAWIVYQQQLAPGGKAVIRLVHPDGTDDHVLLPPQLGDKDQGHPAWSPDGSRIAFDVATPAEPHARNDLWIADSDGSNAHPLASCEGLPCLQLAYPAFSPDGTRLAFARYDARRNGDWGPSAIEILELESGRRTIAASTPDGRTALYVPRWSPDGHQLVFAVETYSDESEEATTTRRLAVITVGSKPARWTLITPDTFAASEPDWAPSQRIVFTRSSSPTDMVETGSIATVAADGSDTLDVTSAGGGDGIEPTWLPDGRVMYIGHGDGQEHVVRSGADGSEPVVSAWSLREPAGAVVRTHAHLQPIAP